MTIPNEMISRRQLETAWKLSVVAADWHERQGTDDSRQRMLDATDYAEQLQALFDKQYEAQNCTHQNAYITYNEPDDKILKCPDCGCLTDEDGIIIQYPNDEIPY